MARNRTAASATDPVDELVQLAIELNLTSAAGSLRDLLSCAERQGSSFTEFALSIFRAEATARSDRRLERNLRQSHLGTVEGLEGFNLAARPQLEQRVLKELHNGQFVREKRNVLCLGKSGLGKTRIAKSITHAACVAGYSTLCVLTSEMLEDLRASEADATFKRTLHRYVKPQVLLLDQFGYEPFDSASAGHLFRLVCARHGQGSIVLTANIRLAQWTTLFPSEAQAIATVDRLVDRATILRFTGKSFRNPNEITGAALD
jgi:DNA replication protein DnaC